MNIILKFNQTAYKSIVPNPSMGFFRIKKINGKEYGYIVDNKWEHKGSRQKVRAYLGRIHKLDLKNNIEFFEFNKIKDTQQYITSNSPARIIRDLLEWEIFKFGISKEEFFIDFDSRKIKKSNRECALFVNEGFICGHTLKNLIEFKPEGNDSDGYRLASAFVEAGIKVPQEIFVGIFSKLNKE